MTQLFFSDYNPDEDPTPQLSPQPIVIFGAGGMGREALVLLTQLNEAGASWQVAGFYDDQVPATPTVAGLPYLGTAADLNAVVAPVAVVVAVGSSRGRAAVVRRLTSAHLSFPALVHPQVPLKPYQRIALGDGCFIQYNCLLTCDIVLGRFVFVNAGSIIGHDVVLEDFCSIMPHANVSGGAHLGTGVFVGAGATILPGMRVGAHATVGAGAVVVRELPAGVTAVGVPAKVVAVAS
ncbi:acetyltransferase [Hymenobacter sp. HMF4947]|uniref:Acetyltransferase n=1 Tax=Hymenobacter ginkgonis TaxID=2682976 RepID=A0A7K1TIB0_9BACT|nr:acetyltransferase [Hymenobacter ginkgonis]MVN77901.1 acetyltransferase [Hymenobacter ginkgonis]